MPSTQATGKLSRRSRNFKRLSLKFVVGSMASRRHDYHVSPRRTRKLLECKSTKYDSVLTVLCRNHRLCVTKTILLKNLFAGSFWSFEDGALFSPNQILKRFIKKFIDFHQKFAKIEDFKFDHSKKLLNFPNREFLHMKSYSKFDGF